MDTNMNTTTEGGAPSSPLSPMPKKEGGMGAIVGVIIIVIVLILGGLYFWGERLYKETPAQQAGEQGAADTENFGSSLDTATALEAELNSLDTGNSEGELSEAEKELQ